MTLAESILSGDRLALSRLLTQIENDTAEGRSAMSDLFSLTGRAHLIGVTGAPGTGKSSLVNQLARYYRNPLDGETPRRVAVVAVDPSSPFTGGAILGDRIRMRDLSGDPGVYIRSMATRGSLGGLARTTYGLVQVFDAAGYEIILIETVGAGQAEVDIARLAHTILVVEAPGFGDEIQAIKAGILEIADILVINKADQPGVENTERALRGMLELAHPGRRVFRHGAQAEQTAPIETPARIVWTPPIQRTVAIEGAGVAQIARLIAKHQAYLRQTGDWARREQARLEVELENMVAEELVNRWRTGLLGARYQSVLHALLERRISPQKAVDVLLDGVDISS
jgi:LAO/AO transport system kinase